MTSEYVRLGGQFPEEIEWQIRQFSWPKYRKPLNKETSIRLNNGIRQDLCDEFNQFETLKQQIWILTEYKYGGWLGWYETMIEEYGADVDFAEIELLIEREIKHLLNLWWDGKMKYNIWLQTKYLQ